MENLYVCVEKFNLCKAEKVTIGKFYKSIKINKESNVIFVVDDTGEINDFPLYWFLTGEEGRKRIAKERLKDF